ncbi:hypothetical protein BM221_009268 [Beauveria bassiana]|uniref:Uncharacterized protein n=1 Tax=Beauveria bassiana TaxID=176275 RepID=A0A2N6NCR6_BEABA|nr:hypothetical protein BM221_009268 [Beauveria bassiana]
MKLSATITAVFVGLVAASPLPTLDTRTSPIPAASQNKPQSITGASNGHADANTGNFIAPTPRDSKGSVRVMVDSKPN